MTRIYIRHIRKAGHCASGTREWFASYGFNWTDFLTNGIDEAPLLATEDAFAIAVVEIARAEESNGQS